jgi:hypothetical protein
MYRERSSDTTNEAHRTVTIQLKPLITKHLKQNYEYHKPTCSVLSDVSYGPGSCFLDSGVELFQTGHKGLQSIAVYHSLNDTDITQISHKYYADITRMLHGCHTKYLRIELHLYIYNVFLYCIHRYECKPIVSAVFQSKNHYRLLD